MAKVYTFPVQKHLPQEVEECLYDIAKVYVKTLQYALTTVSSDNPTNAELEEIKDLVLISYAKGLDKAVDELEEP